jgi:lipopolysaccharide transport system ATP-binding protein
MDKDIAIDIRNVSKCYRRYHHPVDRLKELILPHKPRGEEFWALGDISFQIKQGESLGILGQNGSGKSTLLQIITNTLTPTTGTVEVSGRISALLELGSGFNPDFTGRQNVLINGRILGFTHKEVEAKLDEIIEFAEIGDFVDQPVHTYSSGMFVRLAFSAAVVWEPEILIVDEALAVGDIFFQQKCFERIKTLHEKGVTLLFVSHDIKSILTLCDRAAVLDHGKLIYLGDAAEAVDRYRENYYSQFATKKNKDLDEQRLATTLTSREASIDKDRAKQHIELENLEFIIDFPDNSRHGELVGLIKGVSLTGVDGKSKSYFRLDEELTLSIKVDRHSPDIAPLNIGFQLRDRLGQIIIGTNTKMLSQDLSNPVPGESFICQFRFKPQVMPGDYSIAVAVAENQTNVQTVYDWVNNAMVFSLIADERENEQAGLCWPSIAVSTLDTKL